MFLESGCIKKYVCTKIYMSVVEDVISNVRESFLDEGVDEQVLQELKQLWENKLHSSRALEPAEVEHTPQGNIQYVVQPQTQQHMVQGTPIQHQIPVPVQIAADGQISNAASMALHAQAGMFPQPVQALVNMNPGQQITLQHTANGQYILHAVPSGVTQGQVVNLPQQTILQSQQINQVQSSQGIPQLDGTYDESVSCSTETPTAPPCCRSLTSLKGDQTREFEIEIDLSNIDKRKLRRKSRKKQKDILPQFDGNQDTSSSEEDNFDDDDDDDDDDKEDADEAGGEDEEPLNSDDDVSEVDPQELFDTDNVVVCQFEKVGRIKNKWKFNLKDGIMNLDGKDHVFSKGTGEADW